MLLRTKYFNGFQAVLPSKRRHPGTPPGSARLEAAPPASATAPPARLHLPPFEPLEATEGSKSWAKGSSEAFEAFEEVSRGFSKSVLKQQAARSRPNRRPKARAMGRKQGRAAFQENHLKKIEKD